MNHTPVSRDEACNGVRGYGLNEQVTHTKQYILFKNVTYGSGNRTASPPCHGVGVLFGCQVYSTKCISSNYIKQNRILTKSEDRIANREEVPRLTQT